MQDILSVRDIILSEFGMNDDKDTILGPAVSAFIVSTIDFAVYKVLCHVNSSIFYFYVTCKLKACNEAFLVLFLCYYYRNKPQLSRFKFVCNLNIILIEA